MGNFVTRVLRIDKGSPGDTLHLGKYIHYYGSCDGKLYITLFLKGELFSI